MLAANLWVLSLLTVGVMLLASLLRSRPLRRGLLADERRPTPPWSAPDVTLFLGLALVGMGLFLAAAWALGISTRSVREGVPGLEQLLFHVSPVMVAVLALLATVRLRTRKVGEALGLSSDRPGRDAARGVLLYLAAYPLVIGAVVLWSLLQAHLGVELQVQEVVEVVLAKQPWAGAVLSLAIAVLLAPLLEELIFRGFLLPTIARRTGPVVAVVLVAAFFGLLHGWEHAGPTFALGLLLGGLYWKTGSLWVAVGCHAAHNAAALVTAYLTFR